MQLDKITKTARIGAKRRYNDACAAAHGLELVGERWALLVIRELLLGPRRFSDLKADLTGISANVLAQRLSELEFRGLVRKVRLAPPASVQVYEATPWGLEAETFLDALGSWAARSPWHDPSKPLSGVSIMLSLQSMVSKKKAKGIDARIGFVFGHEQYVARLRKGKVNVARGDSGGADAIFSGAPTALAAIIYGGQPLELMQVTGDMSLARRFATLFSIPAKVGLDGH